MSDDIDPSIASFFAPGALQQQQAQPQETPIAEPNSDATADPVKQAFGLPQETNTGSTIAYDPSYAPVQTPGAVDSAYANLPQPTDVNNIVGQNTLDPEQNRESSVADNIQYGGPGVVAASIDTVGRSLGIFGPDTTKNFLQSMGSGELASYYSKNYDALSFIGDFATSLIPGTLGAKMMERGSLLFKGASKIPYLEKLFADTEGLNTALNTVRANDVAKIADTRNIFTITQDADRAKAVGAIYKTGAVNALKKFAGSEAATYLTMNQSDNIYPVDMDLTSQLALHGLFGVGVAGIETAFLRQAVRASLRSPEAIAAGEKAINPLGTEATIDTPGNRDFNAVRSAMAMNEQYSMAANAVGNQELRTNANKIGDAYAGDLKQTIQNMAGDGLPGVVDRGTAGVNDIQTVFQAIKKDPTLGIGMHTFMPLSGDFEQNIAQQGLLDTTLQGMQDKFDTLGGRLLKTQDVAGKIRNSKIFVDSPDRTQAITAAQDVFARGTDIKPEEIGGLQQQLSDLQTQISGAKRLDTQTSRNLKVSQQYLDTLAKYHDLDGQLQDMKNMTSSVITPNGESFSATAYKPGFQDMQNTPGIRQIFTRNQGADAIYGLNSTDNFHVDPSTGTSFKPAIDEVGTMYMPKDQEWTDLTPYQRSTYYAIGQKMVQGKTYGTAFTNPISKPILLTADSTPFHLDMMGEALDNNPSLINKMQLPTGVDTSQAKSWMQFQSIKNKYEDIYYPMRQRFDAQGDTALLGSASDKAITMQDITHAANLPANYFGTEHPLMQIFGDMYMQGDKEFSIKSMDDLQGLMRQRLIGSDPGAILGQQSKDQLAFMKANPISTIGDNFDKPLADDGSFLRNQLVFSKPAPYNLTQTSMQYHAMQDKIEFLSKFAAGPEYVQTLYKDLAGTQAFQRIPGLINTLIDGQQASRGAFQSQDMATRNLLPFEAFQTVSQMADNHSYVNVLKDFGPLKDAARATRGNTKQALASSFLLDAFAASKRFGFELQPGTTIDNGTSFHKFNLAVDKNGELTPRNMRALTNMYKDNIPPEALAEKIMPFVSSDGKYQHLQLDQTAKGVLDAWGDVNKKMYDTANFFRDLFGKPKLNYDEWHIPPKNFKSGYNAFIVVPQDSQNPILHSINANSAAALQQKIKLPAVQKLFTDYPGAQLVHQADVENYYDLHDNIFQNLMDFSDPLSQSGQTTGSAALPITEYGPRVLDDMLHAAQQQYISYSKRTVGAIFMDEVKKLNMLHEVWSDLPKAKMDQTAPSIFQQATNSLFGISALSNAKSPLAVEAKNDSALVNGVFSKVIESVQSFLPKVSDQIQTRFNLGAKPGSEADFNSLREVLGGVLPYTDANDFANNTLKVGKIVVAEDVARTLNAVTANTIMRVLDVGNGVISILGNMVSMPLVMNAMKRSNFGSEGAYDNAFATFGGTRVGKDFFTVSPVRMMAKGIGHLFTDEGKEMAKYATQKGFWRPTMIAAYQALHQPFESGFESGANRLINTLSYPSDKGEMMARQWAYSTGYLVGKHGYGVQNVEDLHAFAHKFANETIANYSPSNKPLMFQGLFGAPLGLFQTYMMNYYGRMFKYVENKDYRSLVTNYALQGSLFGMQTVPGFKQFNDLYTWGHDGRQDVVDSLDQRLGHNLADGLLYGSISNLPKILGADGIALYSRNDANLTKLPAYVDPTNAPVISLANSMGEMVGTLLDQMRTGGQWSTQRTLETLGAYSPNRMTGRMLELLSGVAADQRGNLVSQDTRNVMSYISRGMAMRPLIEAENQQAYARVSSHQAYQEEITSRIDSSLRSIIRSNPSPERLDNAMADGINAYISAGGNPLGVSEFVRNSFYSALLTKNDKKLLGILKNPSRTKDVLRLMNGMNDYQE